MGWLVSDFLRSACHSLSVQAQTGGSTSPSSTSTSKVGIGCQLLLFTSPNSMEYPGYSYHQTPWNIQDSKLAQEELC